MPGHPGFVQVEGSGHRFLLAPASPLAHKWNRNGSAYVQWGFPAANQGSFCTEKARFMFAFVHTRVRVHGHAIPARALSTPTPTAPPHQKGNSDIAERINSYNNVSTQGLP